MSNVIVNVLIDDIIVLISSMPTTSTETRLDETPYNNDTELSNKDSN